MEMLSFNDKDKKKKKDASLKNKNLNEERKEKIKNDSKNKVLDKKTENNKKDKKINSNFKKDNSTIEHWYDKELNNNKLELKNAENEVTLASKNLAKAKSKALKEEGIDESVKFEKNNNKMLTQSTPLDEAMNKKKEPSDLSNVYKKIKKEQDAVEKAENDRIYSQYKVDTSKAQTEKVTNADKSIGRFVYGLTKIPRKITEDSRKYTNSDGETVFLPGYKDEKNLMAQNNYNTTIGKMAGDFLEEEGKQIMTGLINSASGGNAGTALYYADIAADTYKNDINEGYDKDTSALNTIAKTGSNYVKQKLMGGANKAIFKDKSSTLEKTLSNTINKVLKNPKIASALGSGAAESIDEFTDTYVENLVDLATLKKSKNPQDYIDAITSIDTLKEALYSGAIGFGTGTTGTAMFNTEGKEVDRTVKYLNEYRDELIKARDSLKPNDYKNTIDSIDRAIAKPFSADLNDVYENSYNDLRNVQNNQKYTGNNILDENQDILFDKVSELKSLVDNKQIDVSQANDIMRDIIQQQDNFSNFQNVVNTTTDLQKEVNSLIEKVNNKEISPDVANNIMQQINNGTYQENQNLNNIAQNKVNDIINQVNEGIIDREEGIRQMNAINMALDEQKNKLLNAKGGVDNENINSNDTIMDNNNTTQKVTNENLGDRKSELKTKQLDIINKTNPMTDDYHTGIRNADDIRTWDEVMKLDDDTEGQFAWGDYSREDAQRDLEKGTVTVYSSYPIKNGGFVSTSKIQAEEYAGGPGSKIYSKEVSLNDVAWINGDEGQYAKVENSNKKSYNKANLSDEERITNAIKAKPIVKEVNNDANERYAKQNNGLLDSYGINERTNSNGFESDRESEASRTTNRMVERQSKSRLENNQKTSIENSKGLEDNSFSNDRKTLNADADELNKQKEVKLAAKENAETILRINENGEAEEINNEPKILLENPNKKKSRKQKLSEAKQNYKDEATALAMKVTNRYAELDRISKATKNQMLKTETDRSMLARSEAQSNIGKAQINNEGVVYKNFTDEKGNKVSMSQNDIWNQFEKSNIPLKETYDYLIAQLNIDRHNQGVDQFNIPADKSEDVVNRLERQYPDIKRCAENIWQYQHNQLQKKVDAGLITKDSQEYFNENTPHYIRVQRDVEGKNTTEMSTSNGGIKLKDTIQKVKGGTADIMPLKETMAEYEIQSTKAIRRNNVFKELYKSLQYGKPEDMSALDNDLTINTDLIKDNGDGSYQATFFEDGKAITIPINKNIYDAFNTKDVADWENSKFLTIPRELSNVQRTLLTDKNPLFIATNFFKDIGDAPLNSKYGTAAFVSNYTVAVADLTKNGKYSSLYELLGGGDNTYFEKGEFKTDNKKSSIVKAPVTAIEKMNNFVERLPRLTEFITTIKKNGYDVDENGQLVPVKGKKQLKSSTEVLSEALYNSAEITTNFKRGGIWAKRLNRNGAIFLNASIQGFEKQIRNFTEIDSPKRAVQQLSKIIFLGIAPALINHIAYEDDEDYDELQDYIKDEYYLFKGKDGSWIRIPKGRAMSVFGAAARHTREVVNGKTDVLESAKSFANIIDNQIAPNNPLDSNVFSPWFNIARNKSWSGNPIESDYLQSLPAGERSDAKTTRLAKYLGEKTNLSPKKIDYILDQYSGGIGDVAMPMMTNQAENGEDTLLGKLVKSPIKSKFTTNSNVNQKSVSQFYDMKEKLEQKSNSSKATALDKAKYEFAFGKYSDKKAELNNLYAKQREIQNNNYLSDSEKYSANMKVQKEINKSIKETIKTLNNATYFDGIASIDGQDYTIVNKDGYKKLQKINDKIKYSSFNSKISIKEAVSIYSKYGEISSDKDTNGKTIKSKKEKFIEYLEGAGYDEDEIDGILSGYYKKW